MSEFIRYFSVCFCTTERNYKNDRGHGCPVYGNFKPGGVLNAILYVGQMDTKG